MWLLYMYTACMTMDVSRIHPNPNPNPNVLVGAGGRHVLEHLPQPYEEEDNDDDESWTVLAPGSPVGVKSALTRHTVRHVITCGPCHVCRHGVV